MRTLKEINRGDFRFHYAEDNTPGRTYAKHCHFMYEAYLLIEGEIEYVVAGETFRLKSGNLLLIPPAVFHRAQITAADRPYRRAVMTFSPALAAGAKSRPLLYRETREIRALFDRLIAYADMLSPEEMDVVASFYPAELMILLNHTDRLQELNTGESPLPEAVRRAVAFINDNLADNFALDDVAAAAGVTRHYLCHLFVRHVGEGVMAYARHYRLETARVMIGAGIRPGKASEKCGFDNYTTFYRAYKAFYGEAPVRAGGESNGAV